ncbi:transcription factor ILI3-like [Diospyros lotus]|uniref:transcription factor ILI3-like n=1 Tax=Diospyros lotus TaxID=55363 RepID=UPI00224F78B0|nr:transcription factor ILI3-like [Diospyros lotus]
MSSNPRTRGSRRISEEEINNLLNKLQALLPNSSSSCSTSRVPPSKILKETCSYIKRLHTEVDDLSEKLSQLLASMDINTIDENILRSLLQQ